MGIIVGRSSKLPLVRLPLVESAWTKVQATGWTVSNPDASTLRLAWGGGSAVDWSASTETGLALVYPVRVGTSSNGMHTAKLQASYNEATANGIGLGVGFADGAAVVGRKWFARESVRDGSGTVTVRDEADSAGAPYSLGAQTRRGCITAQIVTLTTVATWGKVPGAVTGYNERRYAGTHITFTEGNDLYAVIFAVGDTTAGSVDITGIGLVYHEEESL